MGQVWTKADFDGLNRLRHHGGRGSVLAVTSQNPGPDGRFGTPDDVLAPLNPPRCSTSSDFDPGANCRDPKDRVRNFMSFHSGGANFLYGDGGVRFVAETIQPGVYRALSTIRGGEVVE